MVLKAPSYGKCPACKSLNMIHRSACYKCGTQLHDCVPQLAEDRPPASYPEVDRRTTRRHVVCLPARLINEMGACVPATIRNIGIGGLLFDCATQFDIEDKLTVEIDTPAGTYSTAGIVKHIGGLLSHETPYACGVEMKESSEGLTNWIQELDLTEPEPWSR